MALLWSLLLFAYWLIVPTLASAVLPPAGRLGREGGAVLAALFSWAVLWAFLPPRVWPWAAVPLPLGTPLLILLGLLYLALLLAGIRRGGAEPTARNAALTVALLSPLSEEVLFRGFLLNLALPLLGGWGAVAFTGLLFAAAHETGRIAGARRSPRESAADLAFGLLAGALCLVSGTILVPLALHIAVNALSLHRPERST